MDVGSTRHSATSGEGELCQIFGANGQPPDGLAGGRENRVAYRGCDWRSAGLADAAGRFVVCHDVDFYLWHFVQPQHFVIMEITLLHAPFFNGDLALEGG